MILDPDLQLLEEVAVILDAQLHRIQLEASGSEDPDAFGVFDRLEHVTGLGFAACQNYIASCAGHGRAFKQLVLQLGPKHRTGQPIVALVNAAANYWKHNPEWWADSGSGLWICEFCERSLNSAKTLLKAPVGSREPFGCGRQVRSRPALMRFNIVLGDRRGKAKT